MTEAILFESFYAPFQERIKAIEKNFQKKIEEVQAKTEVLNDDQREVERFNAKRQILGLDIKRAIADGNVEIERTLRAELSRIENDYISRQEQKKQRLSELQEERTHAESEKIRLIKEAQLELIPKTEEVFFRKLEDVCDFYEGAEPVLTRITGKTKHFRLFELGSDGRAKKIFRRLKQFLPQLGSGE